MITFRIDCGMLRECRGRCIDEPLACPKHKGGFFIGATE